MASAKSQAASGSPLLLRLATQAQIDFELDFFAGILARSPDWVDVLKAHAKNLAHAHRHQEGLYYDRRITQLRPTDSLARYNLACSLALTKHNEEALMELKEAVRLGYSDFEFIQHDRDLDSIRKDPRFRAILREHRRNR